MVWATAPLLNSRCPTPAKLSCPLPGSVACCGSREAASGADPPSGFDCRCGTVRTPAAPAPAGTRAATMAAPPSESEASGRCPSSLGISISSPGRALGPERPDAFGAAVGRGGVGGAPLCAAPHDTDAPPVPAPCLNSTAYDGARMLPLRLPAGSCSSSGSGSKYGLSTELPASCEKVTTMGRRASRA
eukprot:COSAG05_NODE_1345_length_5128_cov_2.221316_2_plen_188_part_00